MTPAPVGVVGSGPAAAAVVQALLSAGQRVCVLDVGRTLEPERDALRREMASAEPEQWAADLPARARGDYACTPEGLEVKTQFGSDYSSRLPEGTAGVDFGDVALSASVASGGLSNIWGAAILPYREHDIADWPLKLGDLLPHYRAVSRLTSCTGDVGDPLGELFPPVAEKFEPLELSRQGAGLLRDLNRSRAALVRDGVHFGKARLAMRTSPAHGGGCRYCGFCMHGCPYDVIFSSAQPFADWIARGQIDYRPGHVVRRFTERDGAVEVEYDTPGGTGGRLTFSRLFVSAGIVPTTKIALASLGAYGVPVTGKDSHYFLFPLLRARGARDVRGEGLHTLSQVFIDLVDPALGGKTAHAQIYSYSDIIDRSVGAMLGPLRALSGAVLDHLLIAQVFLHSDYSARLHYELREGTGELGLSGEQNPLTAGARRRVLWNFTRNSARFRALPGLPFVQVGKPGRSLHCGSTFPMSASPGRFGTDLLGRLPGFHRVHLADSSVLPSIPATTVTLSSMANAHRIAEESMREG